MVVVVVWKPVKGFALSTCVHWSNWTANVLYYIDLLRKKTSLASGGDCPDRATQTGKKPVTQIKEAQAIFVYNKEWKSIMIMIIVIEAVI